MYLIRLGIVSFIIASKLKRDSIQYQIPSLSSLPTQAMLIIIGLNPFRDFGGGYSLHLCPWLLHAHDLCRKRVEKAQEKKQQQERKEMEKKQEKTEQDKEKQQEKKQQKKQQ